LTPWTTNTGGGRGEVCDRFWQKIKHFEPKDFDDHYGKNKGEDMDKVLVLKLDMLRDWIGYPILVLRGYDSQGHSAKSFHYVGKAVDIVICAPLTMREQWDYIRLIGFNGIGVYPDWHATNHGKVYRGGWHLDVGNRVQLWRKDKGGDYVYFLP